MATLIPLANVDADLIEQLLDRAFGDDRHARTAYRIREGVSWLEALSFAVLDDDDMLAGTIQLWPVALTTPEGRNHPLIMVGPVAVLPEMQGEGLVRIQRQKLTLLDMHRLSVDSTGPRPSAAPTTNVQAPTSAPRSISPKVAKA